MEIHNCQTFNFNMYILRKELVKFIFLGKFKKKSLNKFKQTLSICNGNT